MKPLIPLFLAVCFTAVGQTPKPSQEEAIKALKAQVERLERSVEESQKDDAALLEQERVAREAHAATQSTTPLRDYFSEYYPSPRHRYFSYRYYPRYHRRYISPFYYPRRYVPLRFYRPYRIY